MERFQVVARSWSNSFLELFLAVIRIVKVVPDGTRILCSLPCAESCDISPGLVRLSGDSRVADAAVYGFVEIVRTRSDIMLSMRLDEMIFPLGFTVFPLDRAPGRLRDSSAGLRHIVGARSQGTSIVCESCNFGDKHALYLVITVYVGSETTVLHIWIRALFVLKIEFEHGRQESRWYRRNRDVVELELLQLLHRVVHVGCGCRSDGVGRGEPEVPLGALIKHHLLSHLLANNR